MADAFCSAVWTTRESRPGSGVLSFVGFILRQATLSCSAPIFLETLGACPLVCGAGARGESVAASGTVAMGGLFGAVPSTPVGALIVSCEGSF